MCLLSVFNERELFNNEEWQVGWKILEGKNGYAPRIAWHSLYYKFDTITTNPDIGYLSTHNRKYTYFPGFHVFLDKKCAEAYHMSITEYSRFDYRVCRVLYRDITSIGFNGGDDYGILGTPSHGLCIVANQVVIKKTDWEAASRG